jgi:hypothetical protein
MLLCSALIGSLVGVGVPSAPKCEEDPSCRANAIPGAAFAGPDIRKLKLVMATKTNGNGEVGETDLLMRQYLQGGGYLSAVGAFGVYLQLKSTPREPNRPGIGSAHHLQPRLC